MVFMTVTLHRGIIPYIPAGIPKTQRLQRRQNRLSYQRNHNRAPLPEFLHTSNVTHLLINPLLHPHLHQQSSLTNRVHRPLSSPPRHGQRRLKSTAMPTSHHRTHNHLPQNLACRHRSMPFETALRWSGELLSASHRILSQRLSVAAPSANDHLRMAAALRIGDLWPSRAHSALGTLLYSPRPRTKGQMLLLRRLRGGHEAEGHASLPEMRAR